MKRNDLKPGMLIVCSNKDKGIIMMRDDKMMIVSDGKQEGRSWGDLSEYNSDLIHEEFSDQDVEEVWDVPPYDRLNMLTFDLKKRKQIWVRDEFKVENITTDKYNAEVKEDGIHVGCQLVTFAKFNELKEVVDKFTAEYGPMPE